MSDQNDVTTEASPQIDELTLLKQRATTMGIPFHPSIGLDKLKQKVQNHLNPPGKEQETEVTKPTVAPAQAALAKVSPAELLSKSTTMTPQQEKLFVLDQKRKAANKLVRVRVTNMNPAKKEHSGEIFTVSNSVVGTIKKYVQFNAEDGWHVPQMILTMMRERKYQHFYNTTDHRGRKIKKGKLVNEFAIEELPPLTQSELKDLAKKQALAQNID